MGHVIIRVGILSLYVAEAVPTHCATVPTRVPWESPWRHASSGGKSEFITSGSLRSMASFWPEPEPTANFVATYFVVPPNCICGPYSAKLHAFGRGSDLRLELQNELLVLKWRCLAKGLVRGLRMGGWAWGLVLLHVHSMMSTHRVRERKPAKQSR